MKKPGDQRGIVQRGKRTVAGMAAVLLAAAWIGPAAEAEEEIWYGAEDGSAAGDTEEGFVPETDAGSVSGTYTVPGGWVLSASGTAEGDVYRRSGCEGQEDTSTITCGYIDTNYTVMEYEQLRDMLTNSLLYSDVDAQISSSASYTDAKDYLYVLISDDSGKDYRDIYCYVVGDRRCFRVAVKEYRDEAAALEAEGSDTPGGAGQRIAAGFVWE